MEVHVLSCEYCTFARESMVILRSAVGRPNYSYNFPYYLIYPNRGRFRIEGGLVKRRGINVVNY